MNFTSSEALEQVLDRRDRLRRNRNRRRLGWFSVGMCAVLLVLTLTVASTPLTGQSDPDADAMGSFLLEARTGGIFAAVVLAFLLGVLITLFCIRKKRNQREDHTESKKEENGGKQP